MALLDAKEFQFGRQNVWATTVGAADLPTTNNSGIIQLGDIILNLSGAIGAPAQWVCTTAGTSPAWTAGATVGGSNNVRSVAGSATLATSDKYLFITAAGTVTLPAPTTALGAHSYVVKATGQPVTITAASGNFDGVATGSITLSSEQTAEVFTDGTNWYTVGRDIPEQISKPASPATISQTDRYVIVGAGTYTMPSLTGMATGALITVAATASSVTIAGGAVSISGAAAVTLTANQNATMITDGTTWWRVGS